MCGSLPVHPGRGCRKHDSRQSSPGHGQFDESAYRDAAAALGRKRLTVVVRGGARDVEMNPWRFLCELLEEVRRRDRAAPASADVADVGEGRLQQLAVFIVERQRPHLLAGAL